MFFSGLILSQKLVETDQIRKVGPKQGVVPQGPCKASLAWGRSRSSPSKCEKHRENGKTMVKIFESMMRLLKKQRGGNFSREFSWNCPDWGQSGLENRQESWIIVMTFGIKEKIPLVNTKEDPIPCEPVQSCLHWSSGQWSKPTSGFLNTLPFGTLHGNETSSVLWKNHAQNRLFYPICSRHGIIIFTYIWEMFGCW